MTTYVKSQMPHSRSEVVPTRPSYSERWSASYHVAPTFCTQLKNNEDFQYLDEELGIVHLPRELLEHEYLEQ